VGKIRDNNGRIKEYHIRVTNGQLLGMTPANLKREMYIGSISIDNLKLTSDNRLIDKKTTTDRKSLSQTLNSTNNTIDKLGQLVAYYDLELSNFKEEQFEQYALLRTKDIDADLGMIIKDNAKLTQLLGRPEYKGCKTKNDVLARSLGKSYSSLIETNPSDMIRLLEVTFSDISVNRLAKIAMAEEKELDQTKIYKTIKAIEAGCSKIYSMHKGVEHMKNFEKKLRAEIKELSNVVDLATHIGYSYNKYLSSSVFGNISNCAGTTGHKITGEEKKKFKKLQGYQYLCYKGYNYLNDPDGVQLGIAFKMTCNGPVADIFMVRMGYVSKNAASATEFMKILKRVKLSGDCTEDAKTLGRYLNIAGQELKEYAEANPELMILQPLNK